MEMENEKTKNMETDVYLCLMEFDNKDVDSYSYVTDGLGMVKIVFVCRNSDVKGNRYHNRAIIYLNLF